MTGITCHLSITVQKQKKKTTLELVHERKGASSTYYGSGRWTNLICSKGDMIAQISEKVISSEAGFFFQGSR